MTVEDTNLDTANDEYTFDLNNSESSAQAGTLTIELTLDTTGASTNSGTSLTVTAEDAGSDGQFQFDVLNAGSDYDGVVSDDQTGNNSIVFAGETVVFDADSDEENGNEGDYVLRSGQPDGDNEPESTLSINQTTGVVNVDTSDLSTGSYYITNDGTDQADLIFEVIEMDFGAEFTDSTVGNLGAESNTTVEFTSDNRGGEAFSVYVTSDEFDDEELEDIFPSASDIDPAEEDGVEITGVNAGEEFDVTFAGYEAGNYSFDFTVADTSATAEDSIEVTETGEGAATFTNTSVTEEQGDIVEQTVELQGASNTASVVIGDLGDTGYQGNFTLLDDDDDGEVTFYFNTYTAGTAPDNEVVTLGEDTEFAEDGEFEEPQGLNDLLDTGDYDMYAMAGDQSNDYSEVLNSYDSVATIYLQERSTNSMTLWTASEETTLDSVDAISSAVEDDALTESQEIAMEDLMVHEVDATGLSGAFGVEESGVVTESFLDGLDTGAYNLTMEQENPAPNREAKTLNTSSLDDSSVTVIANAESDTYYIALDTQHIEFQRNGNTFSGDEVVGEEYTTVFSVQDPALLGMDREATPESDEYETVNSTVTFADREITFDEDPITVGAASEQTISGTTTVAPGSEISFRVSATEDTQPRFVKNADATVQADGTWSVTFDFSDQSVDDTFNVNARGAVPSTDMAGSVVESPTTDTPTEGTDTPSEGTETGTPSEGTATPSEGTATPSDGTDEPDEETTTTTTPGFGVAVALVALLAAAMLAGRRE
ncbi:BGTF surface domain-containing protein [Halolamina sp. CBA1230]|uniref:DUF7827 domain-containing protein n=1 Tax=Halolamina sp. CBA1230 TaxID=1853690 RepID=UPI0020D15D50|nr:BGTF surface domain-containing protein [Halolamina sp. CBA1230]